MRSLNHKIYMEGHKQKARRKIDSFVHSVFDVAVDFPKQEAYVSASQLKRAALSVILNYIEGYARHTKGDQRHFLRIAYGSLKETEYLINFSIKRSFIPEPQGNNLIHEADEIGAILYTELRNIKN